MAAGSDTDRVLLFGAAGQLGTELGRAFADHSLLSLSRQDADFSHPETLRTLIRRARPAVILNAAAYTAVDRAETEPELADAVNHRSVQVLAEEAERVGATLIHYSTDYVFDGNRTTPWVETDTPAPLNVYGRTKLAGEQAVRACCQRYLILRTSWVFSAVGHNFLRTMLRLGRERSTLRVVNDQLGSPTTAAALATATHLIVRSLKEQLAHDLDSEPWAGVYHATCQGHTSWYEFAQAIFALAGKHAPGPWAQVEGIPTSEYPTPARRPAYSVLNTSKLAARFGVNMPHWQDALITLFQAEAGKLC